MKRYLTLALLIGAFSVGGFVGCDDTKKTETDVKVKGPNGSETEVKDEKSVTTKGKDAPVVEGTTAPEPEKKP